MTSIDGAASAPAPGVRFDMAHAFVITAFLAAAVLLSLVARMAVYDILVLLGGVGGIGAAVLVASNFKGSKGSGGLLRRLLNAAAGPGSGSVN